MVDQSAFIKYFKHVVFYFNSNFNVLTINVISDEYNVIVHRSGSLRTVTCLRASVKAVKCTWLDERFGVSVVLSLVELGFL